MELTKSLLRRIVEQVIGNDLLFKSSYNPEDKSILASYYILDENDKFWEVVNIKERENKSATWADGTIDYKFYPSVTRIPKSQVEKLEEINNTGYFVFKIPYWLYKKRPELEVKRIKGNKRFTSPPMENLEKEITLKDLEPAMLGIGADMKKYEILKINLDNYRNPKKIERPVSSSKELSIFLPTKKSGPEHLKENMGSNFSEDDYSEVFFINFRNWIKKNKPNAPETAPLSWMLKKYLDEFISDYELELPRYSHRYSSRIGRALVEKGLAKIHSMRPEQKFTDKYKKTIPWLLSVLSGPGYKTKIVEEDPYSFKFIVDVDFVKNLKEDIEIEDGIVFEIQNTINGTLKNYYNLEQGNPELGEYEYKVFVNFNGEGEWVKKEFSKLKKEIKNLEPDTYRITYQKRPKYVFPEITIFNNKTRYDSRHRQSVREKIRNLLREKGYNEKFIQNVTLN